MIEDPVSTVHVQRAYKRLVWQEDNCWTWPGAKILGYGSMWGAGLIHRLMYRHLVGPIPVGFQIDHLCRNRACSNPLHLEAVTQHENILRSDTFGAKALRSGHCKHGHAFDAANTYIKPNGTGRECKTCKREHMRRVSAAKRAARVAS